MNNTMLNDSDGTQDMIMTPHTSTITAAKIAEA